MPPLPRIRLLQAAIIVFGFALGIFAMTSTYRFADWSGWIPDLAVGCSFVILSARAVRQSRSIAVLAAAVAICWWLGTLVPDIALYWHRGPLVHLLLAAPSGRLRRRWLAWPVAAGYAAAVFPAVWGQPATAITLAVAWVAVAVLATRSDGSRSRAIRLVLAANIALAVTITAGAVAAIVVTHSLASLPTLEVYQAVLIGVVVVLMLALGEADPRRVADLVVELGEESSGDLGRALASALGDPTLVVGYWDPASGTFRTPAGAPIVESSSAPGRTTTIERGGEPFVLLRHEVALDADGELLRAVRAATLLTATNADLRTQTQAAIDQVRRSEQRLAAAELDERGELGTLLNDLVLFELRSLDREWNDADTELGADLARARSLLTHAMSALERAVDGLHAHSVEGGLAVALAALAGRLGLRSSIEIGPVKLPQDIEYALYEVAAEGLTNVAKHAEGALVEISVDEVDGAARLVVKDAGPGGARLDTGTGLRGISARIEALGGELQVASPVGGGTRIRVTIPLAR